MKTRSLLYLAVLFIGCSKAKKPDLPLDNSALEAKSEFLDESQLPINPVDDPDENGGPVSLNEEPSENGNIELSLPQVLGKIPGLVNGNPTDSFLDGNVVKENSENGIIVGRFSGPDEKATYQLISDNSLFLDIVLDDIGYALVTKRGLNFENQATIEEVIAVRSVSSEGVVQSMVFPISIVDVNEPPTQISVNLLPNAEAGKFLQGEELFEIIVQDPDRNQEFEITVKELGIVEGHFFADPTSLISVDSDSMLLKSKEDWNISSFTMTIVVSDGEFSIEKTVEFQKSGRLPLDCQDIKNMFGPLDGNYWLFVDGNSEKPWLAYCYEMSGQITQTLLRISREHNITQVIKPIRSDGVSKRFILVSFSSLPYLANNGNQFNFHPSADPTKSVKAEGITGPIDGVVLLLTPIGHAASCFMDEYANSKLNLEGTPFQLIDEFEKNGNGDFVIRELGEPNSMQHFELQARSRIITDDCPNISLNNSSGILRLFYNRNMLPSVVKAR